MQEKSPLGTISGTKTVYALFAESHFAETHFAESHFAESHFAESMRHFAEYHFAESIETFCRIYFRQSGHRNSAKCARQLSTSAKTDF